MSGQIVFFSFFFFCNTGHVPVGQFPIVYYHKTHVAQSFRRLWLLIYLFICYIRYLRYIIGLLGVP